MGRPERALLASAQRLLRRFEAEAIPFTGPVGTDFINWSLSSGESGGDTSWLHPSSLEEGLKILGRLESQLTVLRQCDEETRQTLGEWAELSKQWAWSSPSFSSSSFSANSPQPPPPPSPPPSLPSISHTAAACEAGMNLLSRQIRQLTDPLGLDVLDDDDGGAGEDSDDGTTALSLDQLAAAVVQKQSSSSFGSSSLSVEEQQRHRLQSLSQVIYTDNKFKYEPFEWVYEGMKPLLLEDVLRMRKGTPAALAMAVAAVGRRAGIPLLPLPAAAIEAGAGQDPNSAAASIPAGVLPPELQLRVNASTQAAAPGPGSWLLRHFPPPSLEKNDEEKIDESSIIIDKRESAESSSSSSGALYVDAATGEVLQRAQVESRFPAVARLTGEEWRQQSMLRTWQGLCRIAMQAHQRRGESDFVAHWMYVGLALDPGAPEWGRALGAPEIGGR